MSKFVEGHIKLHEAILGAVRDLITDKGETTDQVQQVINENLDELEGWYEMREQFG